MRLDKFTTKFQKPWSDAQSIALAHDNAYIEPVHVLLAMLQQDDGPKALLQRAGVNVPACQRGGPPSSACRRCRGNDQVQGGPSWAACCRPPKGPSSAATSSLPASCFCWR